MMTSHFYYLSALIWQQGLCGQKMIITHDTLTTTCVTHNFDSELEREGSVTCPFSAAFTHILFFKLTYLWLSEAKLVTNVTGTIKVTQAHPVSSLQLLSTSNARI